MAAPPPPEGTAWRGPEAGGRGSRSGRLAMVRTRLPRDEVHWSLKGNVMEKQRRPRRRQVLRTGF